MVKKKKRRGPYLSYQQASDWAKSKNIQTQREWFSLTAMVPKNIPSAPQGFYKEEFEKFGWGGFLQTNRISNKQKNKNFCSFEEAQQWAIKNNIKSSKQWASFARPAHIPSRPHIFYRERFKTCGGWGGFLKSGSLPNVRRYAPMCQAIQWAKDHGIVTVAEWLKSKRPPEIPSEPASVYGEEFREAGGWTAFFGVRKLQQASIVERVLRLILDDVFDVTASPHRHQTVEGRSKKRYKVDMAYHSLLLVVEYDGFHFHKDKSSFDRIKSNELKNGKKKWKVVRVREEGLDVLDEVWNVFVPPRASIEEKAKIIIGHLLRLCDLELLKIPKQQYKWLQEKQKFIDLKKYTTLIRQYQGICSLEEASAWAKKMGFKTQRDWRTYKGVRPANIPSYVDGAYGDEFIEKGGWGWFLGTGRLSNGHKKNVFRSYEEASKWAQDNNIQTIAQWSQHKDKRPADIPGDPRLFYKDVFRARGGWPGFLNTGRVANRYRVFRPMREAATWARDNGISTSTQWKKALKTFTNWPSDVPRCPPRAYKEEFSKAGGWPGFWGSAAP